MTEKQTTQTLPFRKGRHDPLTLGAWWWDLRGIDAPREGVAPEDLLAMLRDHSVSELYLDLSGMAAEDETPGDGAASQAAVRAFVRRCGALGIRVAALTGASGPSTVTWLDPARDYPELREFVERIAAYNRASAPEERVYGVHLDVEPHTIADWAEKRALYVQQMGEFTAAAARLCRTHGLELEYDLFGGLLETDMVRQADGPPLPLLEVMTRCCDTVGVMSYCRAAEEQMAFGPRRYLPYARRNRCRLVAGSETMPVQAYVPEEITYASVGWEAMCREQARLRTLLLETGYDRLGGAIHHVYTWYALIRQASAAPEAPDTKGGETL